MDKEPVEHSEDTLEAIATIEDQFIRIFREQFDDIIETAKAAFEITHPDKPASDSLVYRLISKGPIFIEELKKFQDIPELQPMITKLEEWNSTEIFNSFVLLWMTHSEFMSNIQFCFHDYNIDHITIVVDNKANPPELEDDQVEYNEIGFSVYNCMTWFILSRTNFKNIEDTSVWDLLEKPLKVNDNSTNSDFDWISQSQRYIYKSLLGTVEIQVSDQLFIDIHWGDPDGNPTIDPAYITFKRVA